MPDSSYSVALGPVTAVQGRCGVWGRLARSGDIWGGWCLVGYWFAGPPRQGRFTVAIRITGDTMTVETGNRVVATVRFSEQALADGNGAWIVSTYPVGCSPVTRRTAVLTVAGLGRAGTRKPSAHGRGPRRAAMNDRLIRSTTALAVVAIADVAARISYELWPRSARPA